MRKNTSDALARFYARRELLDATNASLLVGDRFLDSSHTNWHSGELKGVHTFKYISEVVSTDDVGIDYNTVEILSESGRPPFLEVRECPFRGSATHLHIVEQLASGSIVLKK